MPLLPPNIRGRLVQLLLTAFPASEFEGFLRTELSWELSNIVLGLIGHGAQVERVVRYAEGNHRVMQLLDAAILAKSDVVEFATLRTELLDSIGAADGNHFETCRLFGSPFFNRRDLRDSIQSLIKNEKRILSITGDPGTGRTYSANLIHHLAIFFEDVNAVEIDLQQFAGRQVGELLQRIVVSLGWSVDSTVDRGDDAGAKLSGLLRSDDRTIWLILDNCNTPGLLPEIDAFIGYIAEQAVSLTSFRLILLANDEAIPVRGQIVECREEISLPKAEDLQVYLQSIVRLNQFERLDDDVALSEAASIMSAIEGSDNYWEDLKTTIAVWEEVKLA